MATMQKVAVAIMLLGGLALARSESVAQADTDAVKVGNYCPTGYCWVNGKCVRDCW